MQLPTTARIGKRRSQATLRRGLKALGPEVVKGLRFVCSDMWTPYLQVLAAEAGQALQVLDRFHITTHLNQAVDRRLTQHAGVQLFFFSSFLSGWNRKVNPS